jgi:hypothetical protein
MKSTKSNSAKIIHDQFHEETISKRRNANHSRNPLLIDANYPEYIGRFISKRTLPNVLY